MAATVDSIATWSGDRLPLKRFRTRRRTLPMVAAAVGSAAAGALLLTAPMAAAMTFKDGCAATTGKYWADTKSFKEFCQWTDKNGTTWQQSNPLQIIAPNPGQGRQTS
jgi:hypothetical protein